jgi:hypothetical protein
VAEGGRSMAKAPVAADAALKAIEVASRRRRVREEIGSVMAWFL